MSDGAQKTLNVHAFAIADTVPLKKFEAALGECGGPIRTGKTDLLGKLGEDQFVVVHDFGAIVFFGVPDTRRKEILATLIGVVGNQPRPPLEETFALVVDPAAQAASEFDRVVIPHLSEPWIELIGLVIGQSAAMEYYEDDVERILERLDRLAEELANSGRTKRNIRELTQFIGEAMHLRGQVILTLALLDAPLATWNDQAIDRIYGQLRTSFAIDDRYRALDEKLEMVRDHLGILVDLTVQKRSYTLEILVVLLIAVEVILYVFLK